MSKAITLKLALTEALTAGEYTLTIAPVEAAPEPTPEPEPAPEPQTIRIEAEDVANSLATVRSDDPTLVSGKYAALLVKDAGVSVTAPADLIPGTYTLGAWARQQQYNGNAILAVTLNGAAVGTREIGGTAWNLFPLVNLSLKPGDVIGVTFTNDAWGGGNNDRNAYLDYLILEPGAGKIPEPTIPAPTPTPSTPTPAPEPTPTPAPAPTPTGGVKPIDPDATPESQALLRYLYAQRGKGTLIGQNVALNNGHDLAGTIRKHLTDLVTKTGKAPALVEFGVIDNHDAVAAEAIKQGKAGSIIVLNAHWPDPYGLSNSAWLPKHHYDSLPTAVRKPDLTVLRKSAPDSAQKRAFYTRVDLTIAVLLKIQAAGLPVIFRLFHEMNLLHFWWGYDVTRNNVQDFIELWKDVVRHFRERGVHNMLLMYAPSRDFDGDGDSNGDYSCQVMTMYPGNDWCDAVGWDVYDDTPDLKNANDYTQFVNTGKPIFIHEIGPRGYAFPTDVGIIARTIDTKFPLVVGTMNWHDWEVKVCSIATSKEPEKLMNHPRMISRDEVAWRNA